MLTPLNVASGVACWTMIAPAGTVLSRREDGAVGAAAGKSGVASQPPSTATLADETASMTRWTRRRDADPAGRAKGMRLLTGRGRGWIRCGLKTHRRWLRPRLVRATDMSRPASPSGGGPVRLARPSAASHGQRNPLLARQRNGAASSDAAQTSMKTEHEEDV